VVAALRAPTANALGMEAARNRAFAWLSWADLR
jgi:hypothetical protein